MFNLGPTRRWKVGDILFASNDLMTAAYVVTDEPDRVGTVGWFCQDGGDAVWVEYVDRYHGKAWSNADGQST
jgi:hypothetical protein